MGHGITALNGGPEFSFTEAVATMLQMTKIDIAELERAYAGA
jgi:predicted 3-demethylubiquinone-9 3-methyltransferase (glyoxalase superfamily)